MMPPKDIFHFDNEVVSDVLLLVEGIEDARFCNAILCSLKRKDVQISYVKGKDNFRPFLTKLLVKSRGFSRLRRLGIVRDADKDASSTLQSLRGALQDAKLPAPQRPWRAAEEGGLAVSLAILPDESSVGNLEDLCLRSLADSPEYACVDQYVRCRESFGAQISDNRASKSMVYTYLSVGKDSAEPGLRLGEAAEAGVWDWEAPGFSKIVRFLQGL